MKVTMKRLELDAGIPVRRGARGPVARAPGSLQDHLGNQAVQRAVRGGGASLPDHVRAPFERRLHVSLGDVRLHAGSYDVSYAARALGTPAFTVGRDIFFDQGRLAPETPRGQRLLAHELTHVAQQRSTPASATRVSDRSDATEREADGVADAYANGGVVPKIRERADERVLHRATADEDGGLLNMIRHPFDLWERWKEQAKQKIFQEWWNPTVGAEGGFANVQGDRGGPTNHGVTLDTFKSHAAGLLGPAYADIDASTPNAVALPRLMALSPEQASLFGRLAWGTARADELANPGVAMQMADLYWGGNIPEKQLVALLPGPGLFGRVASSVLGFLTGAKPEEPGFQPGSRSPNDALIEGLNALSPEDLIDRIADIREEQFREQAKVPDQKQFLGGWLKRTQEHREHSRQFAGPYSFAQLAGQLFHDVMEWAEINRLVTRK